MPEQTSKFIVSAILFSGPIIVVEIIGLFMSLQRWRRHPQVSLLAFTGFGLFFLNTCLQLGLRWFLQLGADNPGYWMRYYQSFGLLQMLIWVTGLALLLGAIFSERTSADSEPRSEYPEVR